MSEFCKRNNEKKKKLVTLKLFIKQLINQKSKKEKC